MLEDEANTRLGTLLERAGIVTSGDIAEAVAVSKRLQTPIGRVLIMSGCVTEQTLSAALEAQTLLRDRTINLEAAIEALIRVAQEKIPLKDALVQTDKVPQPGTSTNKLGEILMEFGLINKNSLDAALQTSAETGMPLGSSLVCLGAISPSLLPLLLRTQEQIRDGLITRQQAVSEFREAYAMWTKAKESVIRGDNDSGLHGTVQPAAAQRAPEPAPIVASSYQDYYRKLAAQSFPNRQTGDHPPKQKPVGYQQTPAEFVNYKPKAQPPAQAANAPTHLAAVNPAATTLEPSLPPPGTSPEAQPLHAGSPSGQRTIYPPNHNVDPASPSPPPQPVQPLSSQATAWTAPPSYDDPRATLQQAPNVQASVASNPSGHTGQVELSWPPNPSVPMNDQRSTPTPRHTDVAMPAFERAAAKQQHTGSLYSPQSTSFDMPAQEVEPAGSSSLQSAQTTPSAETTSRQAKPLFAEAKADTPTSLKKNGNTEHPPNSEALTDQRALRSPPLPPAVLAAISSATKSASVDPVLPAADESVVAIEQAVVAESSAQTDSVTIDPSTTTIPPVEVNPLPVDKPVLTTVEQSSPPSISSEASASSTIDPNETLDDVSSEPSTLWPEERPVLYWGSSGTPSLEAVPEVIAPPVPTTPLSSLETEPQEKASGGLFAYLEFKSATDAVTVTEQATSLTPASEQATENSIESAVAPAPRIDSPSTSFNAAENFTSASIAEIGIEAITSSKSALSFNLDEAAQPVTQPDETALAPTIAQDQLTATPVEESTPTTTPEADIEATGLSNEVDSATSSDPENATGEKTSLWTFADEVQGITVAEKSDSVKSTDSIIAPPSSLEQTTILSVESNTTDLAKPRTHPVEAGESATVQSEYPLPVLQDDLPEPASNLPVSERASVEETLDPEGELSLSIPAKPSDSKDILETAAKVSGLLDGAETTIDPDSEPNELSSEPYQAAISDLADENGNDHFDLEYDDIKPDGKKRKKTEKIKASSKTKPKKGVSHEEAASIISLVEVLKLGGCFTQKELLTAFTNSLEHPTKSIELLFAIGLVDEKLLSGAKLCQSMMQEGNLKPQQAAYVLSSMRSGRMTLESALEEVSPKSS